MAALKSFIGISRYQSTLLLSKSSSDNGRKFIWIFYFVYMYWTFLEHIYLDFNKLLIQIYNYLRSRHERNITTGY